MSKTVVAVGVSIGYLSDHFATRFTPLPMVGLLLQLLKNSIARCPILEGKLGHDAAESTRFRFAHHGWWCSQPQKKLAKSSQTYKVPFNTNHLIKAKMLITCSSRDGELWLTPLQTKKKWVSHQYNKPINISYHNSFCTVGEEFRHSTR